MCYEDERKFSHVCAMGNMRKSMGSFQGAGYFLPPCLRGKFSLVSVQWALAQLGCEWSATSAFISHLSARLLGLQMCTTISAAFALVSGDQTQAAGLCDPQSLSCCSWHSDEYKGQDWHWCSCVSERAILPILSKLHTVLAFSFSLPGCFLNIGLYNNHGACSSPPQIFIQIFASQWVHQYSLPLSYDLNVCACSRNPPPT